MSVAFAIEVTRSAAEARWRALLAAIPASGLALSAAHLSAGPTFVLEGPPEWRAAAAFACGLGAAAFALAAIAALWRGRTPTASSATPAPTRALIVDETGRPALREPGESTVRPMALRAWCTLPGLTLLVVAPYPAEPAADRRTRPATVLLGRDALSDEGWRRLQVWLRWIERGRLERPTP
ncbi:MAG: hypothetical protein ACK54X_22630 [Burkholderiales bacterium]|jgi:hypothetical protein